MKKLSTVLALLCLLSTFTFAKSNDDKEFIVKAGFQPQGLASIGHNDLNTNIGISAGLEYFQYFGNIVALGAGTTYDLPRKFKDSDYSGNISFLPLYVGVKLRTPLHGLNNNYAFLSGRLGYSALMTNNIDWKYSNGGGYYAAGLGINIDVLVVETVYAINKFDYKTNLDNKNNNASYSTITLYIGFKFE